MKHNYYTELISTAFSWLNSHLLNDSKKASTQEKLRMMQMKGKVKPGSSISIDNVSALSCWLKPILLLYMMILSSWQFLGTGITWFLTEEFRMEWGKMVCRRWQRCWILYISEGKTALFETCFVRLMSSCNVQMMDILCFYRLSWKALGFLSRAPFTFYVTSVHAQQIWRQNCTSDRSDESLLISKHKLYLKGKHSPS